MAEYMGPTYSYLDYLMSLQEITAKEQRAICSNTVESNPATPHFLKDSPVETIVFPPFVKRSLLRDCFNYLLKKKEFKQDE